MIPHKIFEQRKQALGLTHDPAQAMVIKYYDALYKELQAERKRKEKGFSVFSSRKRDSIKGLYVWGDVGRGKTLLMDVFYDSIAHQNALRMHYHEFMQMVNTKLNQLGHQENTLVLLARDIAQQTRVLCLDEFHVNDIGDAMILGKLLEALFKRRVALVTTSNRPPQDLYQDGLQRERFIPAIKQLEKFCHVIELNHNTDYRLLTLKNEKLYVYPLNKSAHKHMRRMFKSLGTGHKAKKGVTKINGRLFRYRGQSEGVIWFSFKQLCESKTSKNDYLDLVKNHHTVMISKIPTMTDNHNDAARRFLNVLDVLYDKNIKLVVSAEQDAHQLYTGKRLAFEFDRAVSRLLEMQSQEYLNTKAKYI